MAKQSDQRTDKSAAAGAARPTSPPPGPRPGEDHFARLARLLDWESRAEAEQTLARARRYSGAEAERTGNTLVGLVVRDESAGLGGRTLITFAKRDQSQSLPWTRLGVGSPVMISEENVREPDGRRGVVSFRDAAQIQVATDELPEPQGDRPTYRIDLSHDEIARQRQRGALDQARRAGGDRLAKLRDVLLGQREPQFRPPAENATAGTNDDSTGKSSGATTGSSSAEDAPARPLDESQRAAVRFALDAHDVAIIHGPPGTGKTTTLVELIRQAVARREKVVACAPSNLAVDNLLERLIAAGVRAVRLGHPARVLPELRAHSLDLLVDNHHDVKLARKLVREAYALRDKASKWTRGRPEPGAKQQLREEARQLIADARRLEAQVVDYLLDTADVLCVTLTALDGEIVRDRTFDLAVIDEACQTTEPACWIPILRSGRIVLAGDHCQLPPTVVSVDAARDGFDVSLLERLMRSPLGDIARRLDVQYRMHDAIMQFSSREFYDGTLIAADHVREHLLHDLPNVGPHELTSSPVLFIDTAGASYDEELEPDGESRRNPGEADVVRRQVQSLLDAGLAPDQIGVIAPYAAQVRLLRQQLADAATAVEIDSVDGFQGREKEAIVISLVRSNGRGEIGFLGDVRRMNVALTRARRKLIVIGDSATLANHDFYQRLLDYFQSLGAYRSVWEFPME